MKKVLAVSLLTALAWPRPVCAAFYPLDWELDAPAVQQACTAAKSKAEFRIRELGAVNGTGFRGAFVAFQDILSDLNDETAAAMFLRHTSPDKAVRDASLECDNDISKYYVEIFTRPELFAVLKAAAERGEVLDGEDERLVEKTMLDFRRSGMELPEEQREKLKALRQRIVELSNGFETEVAEVKETVSFTPAQMAGAPQDMLARLPRDGDKYKVSLDYPDYFPFMENAKDPEARKMLEIRYDSRGGEKNKVRLAEVLKLRDEAAKLLGYKTHAHYVLDERMAGDPDTVFRFLEGLRKKLKEKAGPELKTLLAMKAQELGKKSDGILHVYDWRYYHNQLMKKRYQVDKEKIREYFPTDLVIEKMLGVYQEALGLRFKEVTPNQAWHPDVKLYEVADSRTGVTRARFFMDLYPREGKYKHAAAFTLVQGRALPDGSYQKPVSAVVANFDKPTPEKPSLIPHSDVETLFHEFGHIMHQTLTRGKYQRMSGTAVARDFVEAPSQMAENWVWNKTMLQRISGHYQDRSKKLPEELIDKMIAAKNVDSGLTYLRQNFFGTYDMTLHTQAVPDSTALYEKLMKEVSLVTTTPGTMPESSFTHLMGYDAGYYGYLWAEVYAQDIFSRFEKEGLTNEKVGRDLRKWILEAGSSRPESEALRGFLGREPSDDAFMRSIGLSKASTRP
ncbi:MAG: M3 family metallopeptidase [Elusimicrobiota bacterium]